MLEISYAGGVGLSPVVSVQFALEIAKISIRPSILGVQGRSRSSMLVPTENSSAVLAKISSKSVSICNLSHARRVNSGKITIS